MIDPVLLWLVLPLAPFVGLALATRKWPRQYWPMMLAQIFLLLGALAFLFASFFSHEASDMDMYGMSLLVSMPLVAFVSNLALSNASDMQSLTRARLYSAQAFALDKAPSEMPTRARAKWMPRGVPWERYSVPKGMPERAHRARRRETAWLVLMGVPTILIWGLMLGNLPGSPAGWMLLDAVALSPLLVLLFRRRTRFAGELERHGGSILVQVIDPIRPDLLEVRLSDCIVVRAESDVAWVSVSTPEPHAGRLVVGVSPNGLPQLEETLVTDDVWQRVIWLGSRPLPK